MGCEMRHVQRCSSCGAIFESYLLSPSLKHVCRAQMEVLALPSSSVKICGHDFVTEEVNTWHAGKPMLCFGKYALALGIHVPLGIAGAMLPYMRGSGKEASSVQRQLQGWMLGMGILSLAMTLAGAGTGFVLAIWALSCCLTLAFGRVCCPPGSRSSLQRLQ